MLVFAAAILVPSDLEDGTCRGKRLCHGLFTFGKHEGWTSAKGSFCGESSSTGRLCHLTRSLALMCSMSGRPVDD